MMTGKIKKVVEPVLIALALGWVFAGVWYLSQPVRDGEFRYFIHLPSALLGLGFFFADHFQDFFWTSLIAFSGLGISFLIFEKWLKLRLPLGFMLGAGLGVLGLLIFFVGALHLLYPNLLRLVILLLGLAGLYFFVVRARGGVKFNAQNMIEAIIIGIFCISLVMILVHPTTFYDTLAYHFSLPRQYLLRNSIVPFPWVAYSHFPQIAEMIYLLGLAVSGQISAQMINLIYWLAIILLARELFSILFGSTQKILSTILLLSLFIFSYLTHLISNDIPAAFFVLAGVYVLVKEEIPLRWRCLLFGLNAGLGCSVKLTLYLYLLIPQSIWLAYILFKAERGKFFRNAMIAFSGFVIICAPFWVRNIISAGNPFYPALTDLLGGPLSREQSQAIWDDAFGVHYSRALLKEFYHIPHEFYYAPIFRKGCFQKIPFFGTAFSAGLILLLLKKPGWKLAQVFIYCSVFYIAWVFSFRLSRFALGLWVILAILSAGGFSIILESSKWYQRALAIVLTISLVVSLILDLLNGARESGWKMLSEKESVSNYLYRQSVSYPIQLGAYPAFDWLNHNSSPDAQILLLGPTSFFYLERKAYAPSFIDWNPVVVLFNLNKSPEEVCKTLNQEPIKYLVFQPAEFERISRQYPVNRLTPAGKKRMSEFFQSKCLKPVGLNFKQVYLYQIVSE